MSLLWTVRVILKMQAYQVMNSNFVRQIEPNVKFYQISNAGYTFHGYFERILSIKMSIRMRVIRFRKIFVDQPT